MLVLLAACTPDAVELDPGLPALSGAAAAALLLPDLVLLSERAHVVRGGALRLRGDTAAPTVETSGRYFFERDVPVVEADERVRIAWDSDGLRVLAWVDRGDLASVLYGPTWLGVGGDALRPGDPGVLVPAGQEVVRTGTRWSTALSGALDGTLAVPTGAVDQIFLAEADPPTPVSPDSWLRAGAAFRDDDGAVLARAVDALPVETLARFDGERLVRTVTVARRGPVYEVRGLVDDAYVSTHIRMAYGSSSCGFSFLLPSDDDTVLIPAGALLYDGPHGAVVGIATEDAHVDTLTAGPDGWLSTTLQTDWGPLPLWVAPGFADGGALARADLVAATWGD
jgi:hypothetical protein